MKTRVAAEQTVVTAAAAARTRRTLSDFDKLWAGQTASLFGSAFTMFALPTLAVLVLHATPLQIGLLSALQTLPFAALGMFAGVLADRASRRRIMIVADCVRCAAIVTVPVAAAFGVLGMPLLCGVALVTGTASVFFEIAYQSYLPAVVPADGLVDANVKLQFSNSGSGIAGVALAGAFVQRIGAAAALAVDAVSYLVSVASLALIRTPEPAHDGPALTVSQTFREIAEGVRVVFGSADLRWMLYATATANLGGSIVGTVALLYAYRVLHAEPGVLGVVNGLAQLGFAGAALSSRFQAWLGLRAALIATLAAGACATACMLFAQAGMPYIMLFVSAALSAFSLTCYNVLAVSYRQARVGVRLQGRMNATMRTFVWGTIPMGALAGGFLGTALGITGTIAVGAALTGVSALWLLPLRERAPLAQAE
ncbi:MAG TPA: MFS transporter [Candidatus Elarobacter sp.]|nr:MFS transporter [Candidatus Elarobacter sp.]